MTQTTGNGGSDTELTPIDWVLVILCNTIGCILGIVYAIQGKPKGLKMVIFSIIAGVVEALILRFTGLLHFQTAVTH